MGVGSSTYERVYIRTFSEHRFLSFPRHMNWTLVRCEHPDTSDPVLVQRVHVRVPNGTAPSKIGDRPPTGFFPQNRPKTAPKMANRPPVLEAFKKFGQGICGPPSPGPQTTHRL